MTHRVRSLLMRQRTILANAVRAHLAELDFVVNPDYQPHHFKLELAPELPSLHYRPPIGGNILPQCPPNRQQVSRLNRGVGAHGKSSHGPRVTDN